MTAEQMSCNNSITVMGVIVIAIFAITIMSCKTIFEGKWKLAFEWIERNFKIAYLVLLIVFFALYCYKHWEKVIVFKPFSGDSLILIFLLILLILPFIEKIKIYDFSANIGKFSSIKITPKKGRIRNRYAYNNVKEHK
jgi:hypothetical protein